MKFAINTEQTGGGHAYKGERSFLQGPYHECARCGSRVHIAEMEWQRGILVCKKWNCQDQHPFLGEREAEMAHMLEVPSEELQPDPKLTEPAGTGADGDDGIIF